MKPTLLAVALLFTAALFWFAFSSAGPDTEVRRNAAASEAGSQSAGTAPGFQQPATPGTAPEVQPLAAQGAADTRAPVQGALPPPAADAPKEAVLEFIHGTAITYDARELPKLRPYLTHPDPEMREAALQGMITLGDVSAVPLLRAAAKEATDPKEMSALLEAAQYLELPPASMVPALKRKKAAKAGANP